MIHTMAEPEDTWGIPGPAFAVLYLVVTVALVLLALRLPLRLDPADDDAPADDSAPRGRVALDDPLRDKLWTAKPSDPTAEEMAYLTQRRLALHVALTTLLVHGAVRQTDDGHLVATDRLPATASPLQRAVHTRVAETGTKGRPPHYTTLLGDADVVRELDAIGDSLRRRGYVRSSTMAAVRVIAPAGVLLVALVVGYQRAIDGMNHDKPVMILMLEIAAVLIGLIYCVTLAFSRDFTTLTPRAKELLEEMREDYGWSHQVRIIGDEPQPPSGFTPARAPLSVALFGAGAMQALYPEVVTSLHVPMTGVSGSGPDGGSSNAGGGGSCGGGGGACGG